MSGERNIINYPRLLPLGLALAITFNLLPPAATAIAVSLCLLILLPRIGWPALLASVALFGIIYFSLLNLFFSFSLTIFQIFLSGLMVLMIIFRPPKKWPQFGRRRVGDYLVWVAMVWILMVVGYLTGPRVEYSTYFITYFLIYGTSFVVAGILVVFYSVKLEKIILPSLLIFSCLFPQLGLTPLQMPSALDSEWGLRVIEGFTAINHARLAGLLFVMLLIQFTISARKLRMLPELLLGSLICLSIVWYSYTRQAIAAVLIMTVVLTTRSLFIGELLRKSRQKAAVLFFAGVLAGGVIIWYFTDAPGIASARIIEGRAATSDSDEWRLRAWSDSWRSIKANPIIGYGLGWYSQEYGRREFDWPHNWFIEVWLEHGLAGLILFLIGAGFILTHLLRAGKQFSASWALAGLYWLIVIQLSGDIARNSVIFFFISVCALGETDK